MPLTRRRWLELVSALPVLAPLALTSLRAQRGLEQFAISAPPCKDGAATPAVKAAPRSLDAFRPGAPARAALVEAATAGQRLTLSGTVVGLTCGRIKGARVDFWQADASGVLDTSGFRLRGHQLTDAEGRYRVATIVPGAIGGGAPHIGIRVDVPGKLTFETAAFLPDDPRNAKDARFRPALAMKSVVSSSGDGRAAIFDIALDL
jgi:protocatechuate 3,4-dioxygenase beta subunit